MNTKEKRIVIVEDDALTAMFFEDLCEEAGFEILGIADEANEAERLVLSQRPSHVLLDHRLKGEKTGADVLTALWPLLLSVNVVLVTGSPDPVAIAEIRKNLETVRVLTKPVSPSDLIAALEQ